METVPEGNSVREKPRKDPSKIKRRITQACILCRKKKIKCDGTKPECLHCQESNLQCQYTEYKKRGPHKGYVRLLEERLVQLERKLASTGAEVPPPIAALSKSPHSPITTTPPLSASIINKSDAFRSLQPQESIDNDNDFPPPEIVNHLIDLFFQYINSVFPFVHRGRLKQSIKDGTVSKPLLWSVMAIAARFSNHPSIKSDPPYWAGERFATKATSMINASLLEPTIPNLQFWGIMSCLEYGRASGTTAWIYNGIAVRICQELGLNKESTLKTLIVSPDGTIDYIAMALRRRIFWSCLCIDKFASTSINRPQGFEREDYDAEYPNIAESRLLRDPLQGYTIDRLVISNDPLMDFIPYYLHVLECFGTICKYMSRADKTDLTIVTWPPIPEFEKVNSMMQAWHDTLPQRYQFNAIHLQTYRETASQNYLNFWLCSHAMYCTGMLALHRGSLAYSDLTAIELAPDVYEKIQLSIQACKDNVNIAMDVFKALRDICGYNVLPYMCYCAYIFSTVLMTSVFSSDPQSYRKSSAGLVILFDTIQALRPYWPMVERLSLTTRDMLSTHSRLYDAQQQEYRYNNNNPNNIPLQQNNNNTSNNSDIDSSNSISSSTDNNNNKNTPNASSIPSTTASSLDFPSFITNSDNPILPIPTSSATNVIQPPSQTNYQPQQSLLGGNNNDIDFNSYEFLYDSALFGQIIFDTTTDGAKYMMNNMNYGTNVNNNQSIAASLPTTTSNTMSMYPATEAANYLPQQQQQVKTVSDPNPASWPV